MKRNKNEHKLTEKIIKSFKFRLVRMRSAVRIRPAAPENPRNHAISGIFLTFSAETVWVKMWVNRLTHTVTHTRKRADGSSGNRDVEEYFNSSENDQKRPENDIFRIFLLFVISRSGVRVRLPAPIFPQRSKLNMGEFPSGQRGQTVNLLSVTSVVRIHLPPPRKSLRLMA